MIIMYWTWCVFLDEFKHGMLGLCVILSFVCTCCLILCTGGIIWGDWTVCWFSFLGLDLFFTAFLVCFGLCRDFWCYLGVFA